jgi:hypothetical protein
MTPFEIALTIRNRPDHDETVRDFALRTMAEVQMRDFGAAIELLIRWERGHDDFKKLIDILRPVGRKTPGAKIAALIAAKRKIGYDAELEAILARRWRCPHCKQFSTIDKIEIPIGDPDRLPHCVTCGEEGIAPVDTEARLDVRDGGKSGLQPT